MYSEERKEEIENFIIQKGSIEVNMLAERFRTSRETIRRDLSDLERQGAIKRTHGGAVLKCSPPFLLPESPVGEREMQQRDGKRLVLFKATTLFLSIIVQP